MTFADCLIFVAIYVCVYSILHRVCQCVEYCAAAKAISGNESKEETDET